MDFNRCFLCLIHHFWVFVSGRIFRNVYSVILLKKEVYFPLWTVCVCVCVHAKSLSSAKLFATPCTVARQALVSMGFPRQGYWSRLPFPSPGDLPNPGIEPVSPTLQADSLPLSHLGSQSTTYWSVTHFTKLDSHNCSGGNTFDCVNNLHLRGLSHIFWYFNYNFSSHNIVL